MKGWIKRWIILPFFVGCKSDSSVAIASTSRLNRKDESCSNVEARTFSRIFRLRKPNVGRGIHRLIRSFRNVSPMLSEEGEMEIGFPTDVKHLTHIGWDASMTSNTIINSNSNSEIMSLPSIPVNELDLEMAMAAQASCTIDSTG